MKRRLPKKNLVKSLFGLVPPRFYVFLRGIVEGGYAIESSKIAEALRGLRGPLLDVGCGAGEMPPPANGMETVGLDRDHGLLRMARGGKFAALVCGDTTALPFRDGAFAAAVMCKLGHHLDDEALRAAASEVFRVIAPGGLLVFLDPMPPAPERTFLHNLIARLEIGANHRALDESAAFFTGFEETARKRFRKGMFDLYVITFRKPGAARSNNSGD